MHCQVVVLSMQPGACRSSHREEGEEEEEEEDEPERQTGRIAPSRGQKTKPDQTGFRQIFFQGYLR